MSVSSVEFKNKVLAAYALFWINTYEEKRALTQCVSEFKGKGFSIYTWDDVEGVQPVNIDNSYNDPDRLCYGTPIQGTCEPDKVIDWFDRAPDMTILFLKDFHHHFNRYHRKIRNRIENFREENKTLAVVSPVSTPENFIPLELREEIQLINFNLPDREELKLILKDACQHSSATYPQDKEEEIIDALLGMNSIKAENALCLCLVEKRKFDSQIILREKTLTKEGGSL